jgi:hypothetical protein
MKHIFIKDNTDIYLEDTINIIRDKLSILMKEEDIHSSTVININSILCELETNLKDNVILNNINPNYEDYVILTENIEDD